VFAVGGEEVVGGGIGGEGVVEGGPVVGGGHRWFSRRVWRMRFILLRLMRGRHGGVVTSPVCPEFGLFKWVMVWIASC
jgi:hypothetical protein